jgi:hypothetical protein
VSRKTIDVDVAMRNVVVPLQEDPRRYTNFGV